MSTPATWGEYFHERRLTTLAIGEAHSAFKEAGRRLDACTTRKDELETWARAADKVAPYTGDMMRDVKVNVGEMSERANP